LALAVDNKELMETSGKKENAMSQIGLCDGKLQKTIRESRNRENLVTVETSWDSQEESTGSVTRAMAERRGPRDSSDTGLTD
jgi:hypothetical protein